MAEIWKGAPVAAAMTEHLAERARQLLERGVEPTLAILRLGERPDDIAYERGAISRCGKIGVAVRQMHLSADCSREELLDTIRQVNEDTGIHGCLMLRPLPNRDDEWAACDLLAPEKDVDCITPAALSAVFSGRGAGYPPCTAQACIELLDHYGVSLKGKRVAVIGRSLVIGKPVSMLLQSRDATVTMCHTKTVDMPAVCREAEILIAAAGKAGLVDERFISEGQIVLDVGINVDADGNLCGDVKFEAAEPVVRAITPVPAGVGSVTTAVLAKHVIEAAEKTLG
ncbi:bifunctional 5,10-methylenetetrahydrofolate dehydrogenase/5,10-methenyltetrahydrofolate cyclohydrolase [uncultured Dysosmobacter sp.]|uniref:bifunctional 5,10-methylenetetrahydrofolate dehydrogenase/5,10-methenyltetrahydrofolate cyclohydrolase n=1 Tax=uncultured Dysosmobacter sp. TaxID=2591384 RepID=UPI002636614C|nr:tetrahydrofolate dehydrogenase/cyclohydrolase catalytic domain-containing protein [uncultured Dysosmobacter sp.]